MVSVRAESCGAWFAEILRTCSSHSPPLELGVLSTSVICTCWGWGIWTYIKIANKAMGPYIYSSDNWLSTEFTFQQAWTQGQVAISVKVDYLYIKQMWARFFSHSHLGPSTRTPIKSMQLYVSRCKWKEHQCPCTSFNYPENSNIQSILGTLSKQRRKHGS